jgi:hypothetical protein
LEKRAYIDPDWTPDLDNPRSVKCKGHCRCTNEKIEKKASELETDLQKQLSEEVEKHLTPKSSDD